MKKLFSLMDSTAGGLNVYQERYFLVTHEVNKETAKTLEAPCLTRREIINNDWLLFNGAYYVPKIASCSPQLSMRLF